MRFIKRNYELIILALYYIILISYHITVQYDLVPIITKIDILLTTGFKPSLPVIEMLGSSFILAILIGPNIFKLFKYNSNKVIGSFITLMVFIGLTLPALTIQTLHFYFNHSNRWRFLENWTRPGTATDITVGETYLFSFFLSIMGVYLGRGVGSWLRNNLREHDSK